MAHSRLGTAGVSRSQVLEPTMPRNSHRDHSAPVLALRVRSVALACAPSPGHTHPMIRRISFFIVLVLAIVMLGAAAWMLHTDSSDCRYSPEMLGPGEGGDRLCPVPSYIQVGETDGGLRNPTQAGS